MKKALIIAVLFLGITGCIGQTNSNIHLAKKWQTAPGILTPESALYDPQKNVLFVSDINGDASAKDGNGFISKVGLDGKIIQLHWADGLDAPKGMGMYKDELYAADITQLVIIDLKTGKIRQKITMPDATFLNDITVDDHGHVYISDTRQAIVYEYYDGKISILLSGDKVKGANGLLIWHNKLWILTSHGIANYDFATQKFSLFSDQVKDGDGLAAYNNKDLIASRWVGEVYYVKADGTATKILDTKADHKNTADINYLPQQHLLIVPTFNGNEVDAYALSK